MGVFESVCGSGGRSLQGLPRIKGHCWVTTSSIVASAMPTSSLAHSINLNLSHPTTLKLPRDPKAGPWPHFGGLFLQGPLS